MKLYARDNSLDACGFSLSILKKLVQFRHNRGISQIRPSVRAIDLTKLKKISVKFLHVVTRWTLRSSFMKPSIYIKTFSNDPTIATQII